MKKILIILLAILVTPPISSSLVVLIEHFVFGHNESDDLIGDIQYLLVFEYIFFFVIVFPYTLLSNVMVKILIKISYLKKSFFFYVIRFTLFIVPPLFFYFNKQNVISWEFYFEVCLSLLIYLIVLIYFEKKFKVSEPDSNL